MNISFKQCAMFFCGILTTLQAFAAQGPAHVLGGVDLRARQEIHDAIRVGNVFGTFEAAQTNAKLLNQLSLELRRKIAEEEGEIAAYQKAMIDKTVGENIPLSSLLKIAAAKGLSESLKGTILELSSLGTHSIIDRIFRDPEAEAQRAHEHYVRKEQVRIENTVRILNGITKTAKHLESTQKAVVNGHTFFHLRAAQEELAALSPLVQNGNFVNNTVTELAQIRKLSQAIAAKTDATAQAKKTPPAA